MQSLLSLGFSCLTETLEGGLKAGPPDAFLISSPPEGGFRPSWFLATIRVSSTLRLPCARTCGLWEHPLCPASQAPRHPRQLSGLRRLPSCSLGQRDRK